MRSCILLSVLLMWGTWLGCVQIIGVPGAEFSVNDGGVRVDGRPRVDASGPVDVARPTDAPSTPCQKDSDCPNGGLCSGGTCRPNPCGCTQDSDCPAGQGCNQCTCIPRPPQGMVFTPASGSKLPVRDACVSAKLPERVDLNKESEVWFQTPDGTHKNRARVDINPKDPAEVRLCSVLLLRFSTTYQLRAKLTGASGKTYQGQASYTTESSGGQIVPVEGLTVNLQLQTVDYPPGLSDLITGLNPDTLPPTLAYLATRSTAAQGSMLWLFGRGMAPSGQKPHRGKDVLDNAKIPYARALSGSFSGRWFEARADTYNLYLSGVLFPLSQYVISGLFSADGKNVEYARFSGALDTSVIKQQFGLDLCQLLARRECRKDASGKEVVDMVGSYKGIPNPLTFSAYIAEPPHHSQGHDPKAPIVLYFVPTPSVALTEGQAYSCVGSSDQTRPCDTAKGARRTLLKEGLQMTRPARDRRILEVHSTGWKANTWYRVEFHFVGGPGLSYKTFVEFKTR